MNITEILRGTSAGRMQSVGIMQMIPLLSENHDDRFAPPDEAIVSTLNYGVLKFANNTEKTLIVPLNATYIIKEAAQDHAMATGGLIGKNSSKVYDNSMCVQSTQSGLIPAKKHDLMILPFALREISFKDRVKKSYNKLWEHISSFHRKMKVSDHQAHLSHFYNQFEKQLNQFVAEFEYIPNQLGAIILINGVVVGIERAPSAEYWRAIWKPLIRDCYGSLAMNVSNSNKTKIESVKIPMSGKATNLKDLEIELDEVRQKEEDMVRDKIRKFLKDDFVVTPQESLAGLSLESLDHGQFSGQIVREDLTVVYASLVSKEKWVKNSKWLEEQPFSI